MGDAEVVLALEGTWATAPRTGDLDTVRDVVADDWIGVAPDGRQMDKRVLLELLSARPAIFDKTDYSDVNLALFGSTAGVTSLFHGVGRGLQLTQRFMRVYSKREGTWRCVATQIIPMPSKPRETP